MSASSLHLPRIRRPLVSKSGWQLLGAFAGSWIAVWLVCWLVKAALG